MGGGGGRRTAAEQPEKAGVRHAQHQKQKNEGKQHPNDDVHLVDREGEFVVELFLGVDEIRVVVVQQSLFSLSALGFGGGKFCLLLFQLGLPLGKQCLTAGQLFLPLGLVHFCHGGILRRFFYQYTIEL